MKKIAHLDHILAHVKFVTFSTIIRELKMAGKQKRDGARAKGSGGMRFFHSSAPLCKKYGEIAFNQDLSCNVTISGECRCISVII